jgi:hypothetical protein
MAINVVVAVSILAPEYEKHVFAEYVEQQANNLILLNDNYTGEKIRELRDATTVNPYELLVDLISFELREVLAMKEAIETREFY